MLTVICNRYNGPINVIHDNSTEKLITDMYISDRVLYDIFQGDEFLGKQYDIENVEALIDKIVEMSEHHNIVLHTFNPLVLNYLTDEQGKESLYYADKNGKLMKFFSKELTLRKLEVLGVGEVVSDTRIDWLE